MILIVTSKQDGHVDAVSKHLDSKGVPWIRINTEDFATNATVTMSPESGQGRIFLKDSGKEVDVAQVHAVWYRKPEPICLSHLSLEPAALDYVEAELTEVLQGLYGLLNGASWINNPFSSRLAHRKLVQLKVAAEVGFGIPKTIVTNSPERALQFAEQHGGDLAIKSLGAISVIEKNGDQATQYGIFTRRITKAELSENSGRIKHLPTLFQEFIDKECELRITCVGGRAFACRIEPRGGDITEDDYRFDTQNLRHTAVECPELTDKMRIYMRKFRLNFGCFDFAVNKAGEPVFLECNPNGQWRWVEELTGLPIGAAIADELSRSIRIGRGIGSCVAETTPVNDEGCENTRLNDPWLNVKPGGCDECL